MRCLYRFASLAALATLATLACLTPLTRQPYLPSLAWVTLLECSAVGLSLGGSLLPPFEGTLLHRSTVCRSDHTQPVACLTIVPSREVAPRELIEERVVRTWVRATAGVRLSVLA